MKYDKDLYRQLREMNCHQLCEQEIPAYESASPRERVQRVSLIRAVGVVLSTQGTSAQRKTVREWLRKLLKDPEEKVRRYAMAALPKFNAGENEEGEMLQLLQKSSGERETKFLGRALGKIGGEATLKAAATTPGLSAHTEQKVKANIARKLAPSSIRLNASLAKFANVQINLRCRRGLENIVRDEARDYIANHGKFRITGVHDAVVSLSAIAPFSLADIYTLRCFATVGFVLGTLADGDAARTIETLAVAISSPVARDVFRTFTEGSMRYRLDFIGKGHQRGAIAAVIARAYELCPEILNDARSAPWAIDIHPQPKSSSIELRPKFAPDPRLGYRTDDVLAASHPPLAAAMARVAGSQPDEVVWDPFCGSGLELIERALLGGVKKIYGTDVSEEAIAVAKANVAAAKLTGIETHFVACDFREFSKVPSMTAGTVSLIISNPPMGRRIRLPNIRGLLTDLFKTAAVALRPGGRLVFANPLKMDSPDPTLKLRSRQTVDLGGFDCRLEVYEKIAQ